MQQAPGVLCGVLLLEMHMHACRPATNTWMHITTAKWVVCTVCHVVPCTCNAAASAATPGQGTRGQGSAKWHHSSTLTRKANGSTACCLNAHLMSQPVLARAPVQALSLNELQAVVDARCLKLHKVHAACMAPGRCTGIRGTLASS